MAFPEMSTVAHLISCAPASSTSDSTFKKGLRDPHVGVLRASMLGIHVVWASNPQAYDRCIPAVAVLLRSSRVRCCCRQLRYCRQPRTHRHSCSGIYIITSCCSRTAQLKCKMMPGHPSLLDCYGNEDHPRACQLASVDLDIACWMPAGLQLPGPSHGMATLWSRRAQNMFHRHEPILPNSFS